MEQYRKNSLKNGGNKIHLKLDSGMGRIGFCCKHRKKDSLELDMAAKACGFEHLIPHGVFTHFAVADEGNSGESRTECRRCKAIMAESLRRKDGQSL